MDKSLQIGCGYCAHELYCKDHDRYINKAKLGCENYKHHEQENIKINKIMIQNQLFAEYPEQQRKQMLQDNADAVERISYSKRFSHEQLIEFKDQLAETSIEINSIEIEKKEAIKSFKDQIKPLQETRKSLLEKIRHKAENVEENCFKMVDQENGEVGFYNELGELVYRRPILPQERQTNVFSINKAVNQ